MAHGEEVELTPLVKKLLDEAEAAFLETKKEMRVTFGWDVLRPRVIRRLQYELSKLERS